MTIPVAYSVFDRHLVCFVHQLAASTTFQEIVGANNAEAAIPFINYPYADDAINPGNGTMVVPRPRAIVNPCSKFKLKSRAPRHTIGNLFLSLELNPDPGEPTPENRGPQLLNFMIVVGKVLEDLAASCGQDNPLSAEDPPLTFLNSLEFNLVNGPAESMPENENGALFYGVTFEVVWD